MKTVRSGVLAAAIALTGPAFADAIDGDWCAPEGGQSLSIEGSQIRTPGGARIQGQYSRHNFSYVQPPGDPKPGAQVDMVLMGEMRVRVSVRDGASMVWHRCPPGTS